MCHEVIFLGGGLSETSVTERAFKRLFTRVRAHVTDQASGLIEGLGAVQALEWLLASVSPHMNLEINSGLFFIQYVLLRIHESVHCFER